jgi:HK97 family phage portal protein
VTDVLTRIRERAQGKAMNDVHPEFGDRQLIASLRSDEASTWAPYSYLSAIRDYESHVWVRKAVKVIADNFSPLPLQVLRGDKVVPNHDAVNLLTAVNGTMSSTDLWQQWVVDMLLGGEEGWEFVRNGGGKYVEIWPRQPHVIGVVPDPARLRYFEVAKYRIDDQQGEPYELPPDEMIHFKFFNPRLPWRGIAPITAVRMSIVIDVYAQAWSKLFYQKSARPDYAVIAPQGLGKTEKEDVEKMLAAKFGGAENAFKPIVLEEGITDVKMLSFPPKDLEWIELRGMSREEIGAIFGVPDEIMGWGRDTYENFGTAHWVLWVLTLLPLCNFRDTHLTEYLRRVKVLGPDEALVTDTSQVEALKKDLKTKVEMLGLLAQWGYPVNIANRYLGLGLPEIEGGDVGYLSVAMVPVTSARDVKTLAGKARASAPRLPKTAMTKTIAYDSVEHQARWQMFCKRTEPWERRLGEVVAQLMADQQQDVLARLRSEGGKATRAPADAADEPFDREKWEKEFREKVLPVLRQLVAEAGQGAIDDIAVSMDFDVDEPRVVEFLLTRNQRFAQHVNDTTWSELQQSLRQGLDAGENMTELAARVEAVMGNRIRSSGEVIARTETIGAANGGTLLAWQQSQVVEGKTWLAALDNRVRDSHREAHMRYQADPIGIDEEFEVGAGRGPAPGQIGLPEEDIQCRCSMTAVLKSRSLNVSNGRR